MSTDQHEFWNFIEDFQVAMVATYDEGSMRARPMAPFIDAKKKTLRFLTLKETHKIDEIEKENQALVTFCNPATNSHASLTGTFELVENTDLIASMWGPYAETWFTGSPTSGDAIIMEFKPEIAQFWDGSFNPVKLVSETVRAYSNNKKTPDIVDTGKIEF